MSINCFTKGGDVHTQNKKKITPRKNEEKIFLIVSLENELIFSRFFSISTVGGKVNVRF